MDPTSAQPPADQRGEPGLAGLAALADLRYILLRSVWIKTQPYRFSFLVLYYRVRLPVACASIAVRHHTTVATPAASDALVGIEQTQGGVRVDLRGSAVCMSSLSVIAFEDETLTSRATSPADRNDCPLDAKQGFADMAGVLLLFLLLLLLGKAQEKAAQYTDSQVSRCCCTYRRHLHSVMHIFEGTKIGGGGGLRTS